MRKETELLSGQITCRMVHAASKEQLKFGMKSALVSSNKYVTNVAMNRMNNVTGHIKPVHITRREKQ